MIGKYPGDRCAGWAVVLVVLVLSVRRPNRAIFAGATQSVRVIREGLTARRTGNDDLMGWAVTS